MRRTLRMLRARYRAQALVSKLTDDTNTIASAQALNEGGRVMADLIDVNVVAGADMGCADTVTLHNGKTLSPPRHSATLERAVAAQGRMNACVKGSRK